MGMLNGLGAFAEGFGKGVELGNKIDDIKAKREKAKQEKELMKIWTDSVKADLEQRGLGDSQTAPQAPVIQPRPQDDNAGFGVGDVDYTGAGNGLLPHPDHGKNGMMFADGGLVSGAAGAVKPIAGVVQNTAQVARQNVRPGLDVIPVNNMARAFGNAYSTPQAQRIIGIGMHQQNMSPMQRSYGMQYQRPQQSNLGMGFYNRFADGGLVEDRNSLVTQVNNNTPQQPALQAVQPQKQNNSMAYGTALSNAFNKARDAAIAMGRADLAMDYQNAGFQVRDRMFKDGLVEAQRQFSVTGDIGGFVKLYDAVDDNVTVDGYEKTETGYKLKLNHGGNIFEREYTPTQIEDLVMTFSDPAARYNLERKALMEREQKKFETDEEIRKEKAKAQNAVHTVAPDSLLISGDGTKLYDGTGNRPMFKNEEHALQSLNSSDEGIRNAAKDFLKNAKAYKSEIAAAGRTPKEKSLEEQAAAAWLSAPANRGKTVADYVKERQTWGKEPGLDSITTTTNEIDEKTGAIRGSTSVNTKVPRGQGKNNTPKKQITKDELFKNAGVD